MSTTAATLSNHPAVSNPSAVTARPADNSSSGTGEGTSGSSAGISANDFLTLLVTELQNQDPTSAADPNQYINQLVSVNSLEQLIQINQTLSGVSPAPTGQSSSPQTPMSAVHSPDANSAHHISAPIAPGNLSVPAANPAAQRVAQSLGVVSSH